MMDYEPKKKKKRSETPNLRRRKMMIVAIIIILIGLILSALVPAYSDVNKDIALLDATTIDVEGDTAISQIEQALEITLPDSAANAHFYYTSWLDYFMQIRVDLSANDAPLLLDSISHLCEDMTLQDGLHPFGARETKKTWWRPQSADHFVGMAQCGDNPFWEMLIDQSDDVTWIVYIIGFST